MDNEIFVIFGQTISATNADMVFLLPMLINGGNNK